MRLECITRPFEAAPIFIFAAASPLLLRMPLSRLNALISRPVLPRAPEPERLARTVRAVDTAVRWCRPLISSGCLTRGLTLYWFLRGLGQDVVLVFGAGQVSGKFAAHCWLELGSEPYLERVDPRQFFREIYRFQRDAAGYNRPALSH